MLAVKKLLTNIIQRLYPTNMFALVEHTLETNVTLNSGAYSEKNYTVTKAGYYPLGIVGYRVYYVSGQTSYQNVYQCYISSASVGSATVRFSFANTHTAQAKSNIYVRILWAKA